MRNKALELNLPYLRDREFYSNPNLYSYLEPCWLRYIKRVAYQHFDRLFTPEEVRAMIQKMLVRWDLPVLEYEGNVPPEIMEPRYWIKFWEPEE